MLLDLINAFKRKVVVELPIVPALLAGACLIGAAAIVVRHTTVSLVPGHDLWYPG